MRAAIPALLVGVSVASAQPAGDMNRAKDLYKQANQEMKDGRYADAAKDYGAVYEITHDAVLFFKIASAHQKAGQCDVANVYYNRYLKEAHPGLDYVKLTEEHIKECEAIIGPTKPVRPVEPPPQPPPAQPQIGPPPPQPAPPAPAPAVHPSGQRNGAWILVGGSLAAITIGSVLAYSASSSENDLKDLYISANGQPPTYDTATAKRYNDLLDQGHTYEHLSWVSFGVAGACAIGATILFLRDSDSHGERVTVAPIATPREAGVSALVRF